MKKVVSIVVMVIAISVTVIIAYAQTAGNARKTSKKYAYAELYFHNKWQVMNSPKEMWVNSDHASESVKAKIKTFKYTDDALNVLGSDGWELVAVIQEETNSGTEYIHYFKKELN